MNIKFNLKNREFIILSCLSIIFILLIIFKSTGKINYKKPKFAPVEKSAIDKITWTNSNTSITLNKKAGKWFITDKEYPANEGRFEDVLENLANPMIVDLIAKSGPYERYELSEANRYELEAYVGADLVRSFYVGKSSSSGRYTYIQLADTKAVYTINKNINSVLADDLDNLREKLVLSFERDKITSFSISYGDTALALTKENGKWLDSAGADADQELMDTTMSRLSSLRASSFTDGEPSGELYKIELNGEAGQYSLDFTPAVDGKYFARASSYGFPFELPAYTAESLLKGFGFIEDTEPQEQ